MLSVGECRRLGHGIIRESLPGSNVQLEMRKLRINLEALAQAMVGQDNYVEKQIDEKVQS